MLDPLFPPFFSLDVSPSRSSPPLVLPTPTQLSLFPLFFVSVGPIAFGVEFGVLVLGCAIDLFFDAVYDLVWLRFVGMLAVIFGCDETSSQNEHVALFQTS